MATPQYLTGAVFYAALNVCALLLYDNTLYRVVIGAIFVGWTTGLYCYLTVDAPNPYPVMSSATTPRDSLEERVLFHIIFSILLVVLSYATSILWAIPIILVVVIAVYLLITFVPLNLWNWWCDRWCFILLSTISLVHMVAIMVCTLIPESLSHYTDPIVMCIVTLVVGTTIWWVFTTNARDARVALDACTASGAQNMCSLARDLKHHSALDHSPYIEACGPTT